MGQDASESTVRKLRFESGPQTTPDAVASHLAESVAHEIGCDSVTVTLFHQSNPTVGSYPKRLADGQGSQPPIFTLNDGVASFAGRPWNLPIVINDLQRARVAGDLALELAVRKVRSGGIFPIVIDGRLCGSVECFYTRSYHRWRQEELDAFADIGRSLSIAEQNGLPQRAVGAPVAGEDLRGQYRRMARYGNIIILMTDSQFRITDVFGNTEQILGIPASQMLSNAGIWDSILDPRDREVLRRRITRLRVERDELREEVRVIHQQSGEARWMMLRAIPHFSAQGAFLGWEGFGIDITDRRQAQEALVTQNRRLEALFEVARSLQGQIDPAVITFKGLKAVISATGAHCGYAVLTRPDGAELEVVAAQGLSEKYIEKMNPVLTGPSLLSHVVTTGEGIVVSDLQSDSRAVVSLAKMENVRGAIVMPLAAEGQVLGALVLFKRSANSFGDADCELAQAAASQISLAVRQAELFESERRHNEALSALYRVSQELGKHRTVAEIAQHTFPILEQDFGLKRGWLGIMNEQGTHLAGQVGFGPGVKKKLQQVQVELALRHDFLDEAVRTQRPVMVRGGQEMECSGLNEVMQQLSCELLVIIPLVSLGQVVGAMVVEPRAPGAFVREGRLQLLVTAASEMATVFMARRFEQKMSESFKMRMAGLLASGVAHNFNNLLQAILGQVSLIELQSSPGSQVAESAQLITDAAKRGASLVSQLLSFSTQASPARQSLSINSLVEGASQLYESLLGRRVKLLVDLGPDCPELVGDGSQLQQVLTALLANAKEAIAPDVAGEVTIVTRKVKLRSGEVHPELAPGVYIRLEVRDNGVGMSEEQRVRCFEPFYTTKNVDKATGVGLSGAGLGLSSAYSIIKQHDGVITVDSVKGRGTTCSVYLPVLSVRSGAGTGGANVTQRGTRNGVLMVGMETGIQPYFASLFDSLGCRARVAYDGYQVREMLKRESATYGFVAVDLDTLGDVGASLCSELLNEYPELCIIGIAGSIREWVSAIQPSSRIEFVDKPVGVWAVETALQRLRVRIDAPQTEA